jgi:hypothetical protein
LIKLTLFDSSNRFSCVHEPPDDLTSSSCLSRAEHCISKGYLSRDAEIGCSERSHGRTQSHERDRSTQQEESEAPVSPSTSSASEDEDSQADRLPGPEVETSADEGSQTDELPHPEAKTFADWFIESIHSPPIEYLHSADSESLPEWRQKKSGTYQSYATQLANLSNRQKKAQNLTANLLEFTAGCIYEAAPRLPTVRIEDNDVGVEDSSSRSTMFRLSKKMAFINQVIDSLRPHWGDQALEIYQLLGEFRNFVYRMLSVAKFIASKQRDVQELLQAERCPAKGSCQASSQQTLCKSTRPTALIPLQSSINREYSTTPQVFNAFLS